MVSMQIWDPEGYAKSSAAQQRWAQELLSKFSIRRNQRILDIGCGDGKVTAEIARLVPGGSVSGIDNSVEMISFAQSKFPPACWPNLTFQYGDASNLHFV